MTTDRLLAKSHKDDEPWHDSMALPGHLADVYAAAVQVLDATGDDQLRALGLSVEMYRERFRRIVLLAAAVHDLGKANDHFQGMIHGTRDVRTNPQGLRHEWVTLLMLRIFREWLLPAVGGNEVDFAIVEWAVAGHHPAHNHASPPRVNPAGAGPTINMLMGASDSRPDDFRAALLWISEQFDIAEPPTLSDRKRNLVGTDTVFTELAEWTRTSQRTWEVMKKTPEARLVAAVKDCLIAADVAGSALPKAMPDAPQRWDWITKSFAGRPEPGDVESIVKLRLEKSKEQGGSSEDMEARKRFQGAVAASQEQITYLKAGCGTGKTLAAYMWAAANYPTHRLYFCYPTTGTATEGFRDYLFEPGGELGGIGAKLFHSRSDIDFDIILSTGKDTEAAQADEATRLESLETWSTPIVACTVDTVLGVVQNNKRGLFAWPALAQSVFVFDEIHAYDDRLFGALLRFLRDLPGQPVLLMTASLPVAREGALRRVLEQLGRTLLPIPGPSELEERPRYRKGAMTGNDPLPLVREVWEAGGKVLWVCNTVGRVMDAADRAKELGPLIYHSRFRYEDRVQQHTAVINAFDPKKNKGKALAICSQVAEMSLDLSADLLVTDLAPVPALMQRLGRLNRRAEKGGPTNPFLVVEPDTHLPYTPAELDSARAWLGRLPGEAISQRDLAELWEQSADVPPELVPSAWLDGGPTTTATELREASPGITVLLNMPGFTDHEALLRYDARMRAVWKKAREEHWKPTPEELKLLPGEQNRLGAVLIPMPPPPRWLKWREWNNYKGIPVPPSDTITYHRTRGAAWGDARTK
jgi:CRISPR-associated endonuclease/helicase Cas3